MKRKKERSRAGKMRMMRNQGMRHDMDRHALMYSFWPLGRSRNKQNYHSVLSSNDKPVSKE